jgi:putative hydrolase of the HAD superfamily
LTRPLEVLFLDLDDTLYPGDNGVWQAISDRINRYMVEQVGMTRRQAAESRARYLELYGTSLAGLMRDFDVSPSHYLTFVHDLPLEDLLEPNPALAEMLASLPQRKLVFTNSSEAHAERVLRALGIEDLFESIVGIEALGLVNKPDPSAFLRALELAGEPAADRCALVDDRVANLIPAAALGMFTVLVDAAPEGPSQVDAQIDSVLELASVLRLDRTPGPDHG